MPKKTKSPTPISFEEQKQQWYDKLRKEGFKDIETSSGLLTKGFGKYFRQRAQTNLNEEYYSLARKFIWDYKFDSELERVIWEYHAEGVSYRDIVKILKKVFKTEFKTSLDFVLSQYSKGEIDAVETHKTIKRLKLRNSNLSMISSTIQGLDVKMKAMYVGKPQSV